ncbi:MAG TPA: CBS domain-containing protein [Ignavibacteria bacterium]|nr:CBS domain-containing protein [Ignavibacteria bacterium]
MSFFITFYLSRIVGTQFFSGTGEPLGKVKDLMVDFSQEKPKVIGVKAKVNSEIRLLDFEYFDLRRTGSTYVIYCDKIKDFTPPENLNILYLHENIIDKQILDINGRKLVRVNDIRLARLDSGSFAVAVDVGIDGILRRLGFAKLLHKLLAPFKLTVPSRYILFDEVEAVDSSTFGITLSKPFTKLHTLHPSDLADVIEDLDKNSRKAIFEALDEEKAADVLEELEPEAQVDVIDSLSTEKAADLLEKMPADEAADLIDELEDEKAEQLLNEIEKESSDDIRDILKYEEDTVGSLMATDFISFNEDKTVGETINELRKLKPESNTIYYLYVVDKNDKLLATVSLRDLVISDPSTPLNNIMNKNIISVFDTDEVDSLAEIISKYNLLAIPVTNKDMLMEGVIVIDDIVEDLLDKRKTE